MTRTFCEPDSVRPDLAQRESLGPAASPGTDLPLACREERGIFRLKTEHCVFSEQIDSPMRRGKNAKAVGAQSVVRLRAAAC